MENTFIFGEEFLIGDMVLEEVHVGRNMLLQFFMQGNVLNMSMIFGREVPCDLAILCKRPRVKL